MKICSSCNVEWDDSWTYIVPSRKYERYYCRNCGTERKPQDVGGVEKSWEEKGDTAVLTTKSLHIKTVDQLIAYSKVDTRVWEVDHSVINSWEVTMSGSKSSTGKDVTYTNHQVKAWLRRKKNEHIVIEDLIGNLSPHRPVKNVKVKASQSTDIMQEISIFDHHFGKLAYKCMSGDDYNLSVAVDRFHEAVVGLSQKYSIATPEKILFPIGNDILHINNDKNMTYRGTPQDVDGLLVKIMETAQEAVIDAIYFLSSIAPVKIVWVASNHDKESTYYLCKIIEAYFRNNDRIEVDVSPKPRKIELWGDNMIIYDHGQLKPQMLLNAVSSEYGEAWGKCKYKEAHVGHFHKKKEMSFVTADTIGSMTYRIIPSLCNTDAWHYANGFVGSPKAAQTFFWHKYDGQVAVFNHNI